MVVVQLEALALIPMQVFHLPARYANHLDINTHLIVSLYVVISKVCHYSFMHALSI